MRRLIGLVLGPLLFLALLALPPPQSLSAAGWRTAAVALLMAVWWIGEVIPIPATALLPLALFPLLGISDIAKTAAPYANPVIFLFMGGFMIAQAMQRWGLHRRIALRVIGRFGGDPRGTVGGFMLAAAFLSMWVSNTATAVMMLPIGLSVIELARNRNGVDGGGPAPDPSGPSSSIPEPGEGHFAIALMLGIAYGSSIGGVGTLIGTPPNALLAGFMSETYGVQIGFAQWMLIGVPLVAVMLPIAWLTLTRWVYSVPGRRRRSGGALVPAPLAALGPLSRGEALTGTVFALTALAWIARPLLSSVVPGVTDAGIAIAAALCLFLIPVRPRDLEFVLDWPSAKKLPWDVLLLFGGGLSLADAINHTGLAAWMGHAMAALGALHVFVIMLIVTAVLIFLTELTSNTAAAAAFIPVVASLAIGIGANPLFLVVPAVLAASCAFMLPVATPPNAIVFGSGHVTVPQMSRAGIVLNLLFIVAIPLVCYALVAVVFGARPDALPDWAVAR